jgi:glycosyltransferase involved in cell wall biosynthesis
LARKLKIAICINTSWNIVNFRSGLIAALRAAGHQVIAIAPRDAHSDRLAAMVDQTIALAMDNRGTNPVRDLQLYYKFVRVLRETAPDVYLGYTIKPNVYGALAAQRLGIPVVNNISGLGATFMRAGVLNAIVRGLYRFALKKSRVVFFQNTDDRALFIKGGLVRDAQARLLPGSGVDLERFVPLPWAWMATALAPAATQEGVATPPPPARQPFRFLLISRLLWDKGVGEFVEAARLLRASPLRERLPNVEFALLGACGVQNPAAITRQQVAAWEKEGVITYLGQTDCVEQEIARAHSVVLPSYREGTPRALLEAAACARPVITTNAPGCRDTVVDGQTGLLCRVKDAADLAQKMERMLIKDPQELKEMGARGRALMEERFDQTFVINEYLRVLDEIAASLGRPMGSPQPLGQ